MGFPPARPTVSAVKVSGQMRKIFEAGGRFIGFSARSSRDFDGEGWWTNEKDFGAGGRF